MSDAGLKDFLEEACDTSRLRVEDDLGGGFVRLRSDEAARRQAAHDIRCSEDIVIEMLRNARDAHAHTIFLATGKTAAGIRTLLFLDDGDGIPPHMHELIFEPRVTSKLDSVHFDKWGVHGRGMALYAVAQNSTSHAVVASMPGRGSALKVVTNTGTLTEKADQSSFPTCVVDEERKTVSLRGPKNILRTASEFALEHRDSLTLYCGSFGEILSTIRVWGASQSLETEVGEDASLSDEKQSLICELASACDVSGFAASANALGFDVSQRTARRAFSGDIAPLEPLSVRLARELSKGEGSEIGASSAKADKRHSGGDRSRPHAKARKVVLSADDTATFGQSISDAFAALADAYYLDPNVSPKVTVCGGELVVKVPLIRLDD